MGFFTSSDSYLQSLLNCEVKEGIKSADLPTRVQLVDNEIRHLQVQQGIANTARNVHVQLLKAALADPMAGDTIKLG